MGLTIAEVLEQNLRELPVSSPRNPTRKHIEGVGSLILRGRIWWIRYSVNGERREESSRSPLEKDALKFLVKRKGEKRRLNPVAEEKATMGLLFDALVEDYKANTRRSLDTLKFRLAPLRDAFADHRAVDVRARDIKRYRDERLKIRKVATVNRELAALRRAFKLALHDEILTAAPHISLMAEHNAKEGFVTPGEFEKVVAALPAYLVDVARFGYLTGWRLREVTTLEWSNVDVEGQRFTLPRRRSKNGRPRTVPIVGDLADIIARRWADRAVTPGQGATLISPLVFHRGEGHGKHRGEVVGVGDFRKAWRKAVKAAGKPGLVFHDFRRSAVRNLTDAGVDQAVAMEITGHETDSIFRRYRIVNDANMRAALVKTEAAMKGVK